MQFQNKSGIYPLFRFLCECRKVCTRHEIKSRLNRYSINLHNGFAFWIKLCSASSLLTGGDPPKPTPLCSHFLSWDPKTQYQHLLNGWVNMIRCPEARARRKSLVKYLVSSDRTGLIKMIQKSSYSREIRTIIPLTIFEGLTSNNHVFHLSFENFNNLNSIKSWEINEYQLRLVVPLPAKWELLWEIEELITPIKTEISDVLEFSLESDDVTHLDIEKRKNLINLIRSGSQSMLPSKLKNILEKPGWIKCQRGYLFSFCNSNTLIEFRQQKNFLHTFNNVISPNHVFLNELDAQRNRNFLSDSTLMKTQDELKRNFDTPQKIMDKDLLSEALTLGWYARIRKLPIQVSNSKLRIIMNSLPEKIVSMALQHAENAAQSGKEHHNYYHDENIEDANIIRSLIKTIEKLESIHISYKKPEKMPENRKIYPLLLEKRGAYTYLIAFCQEKCARRTFRVDRILSCW